MKHYCNPLNLGYRYQYFRNAGMEQGKKEYKVFREAADPTLVLFKDIYFLFPSMTAGFYTSEDLLNWKYYDFGPEIPIYDYAPDVCVVGEYLYFSASRRDKNCSFYRTKDPRTEKFEEIEGEFPFWDPDLFMDEDGRLYFYWGCSNQEPIYGVELDPETMKPLHEKKVMFDSDEKNRGYERIGDDHMAPKTEEQIQQEVDIMIRQMKSQAEATGQMIPVPEEELRRTLLGYMGNRPYIEGPWMTKHAGKYYLQYAIPGTQYNVYGDGVYVSDDPLGPFHPAKNNPYSYKPGGFITGAGHGSTLEDKSGDFWHIASMRISHNEGFERRVGMWKADFDEEGELYCDQRFGDWPIALDAKPFDKPDWMLLSYGKDVTVSSGNGKEYITDEDIRTFWKASSADPGEWASIDLGEIYEVCAVQINFQDDGLIMELPEGQEAEIQADGERFLDLHRQYTRWLLEGSVDGTVFTVIEDKKSAATELPHDYLEFDEPLKVRYLKLTIECLPYHQPACVSGIRVFGKGNGETPKMAENVSVHFNGDLDMEVSWNADEYSNANVLWGYSPDKLYHSRMVFGQKDTQIGALVKGQPVYIRVDTFNENGITEGCIITCR